MKITYDLTKNEHNIRVRGLSFDCAVDFYFENSIIWADERKEYGETRYIALGYLFKRLHVLCFTETEEGIRVISFRKANTREGKKHGKPLTQD
jgi:hypothetical protein